MWSVVYAERMALGWVKPAPAATKIRHRTWAIGVRLPTPYELTIHQEVDVYSAHPADAPFRLIDRSENPVRLFATAES